MAVDSTTQAALEAPLLYWRALIYADFEGDTLRATTGIYNKVISGSGDAELDGTYDAYNHNIIEVSPVSHNETGSDTVSVTMSGIISNSDLLNLIGDRTKWQGRSARLWFYCVDQDEAQVGSIIPYYTGYMNDITISGTAEAQRIALTIENYIVSLSGAPNRTMMMQKLYDSGDESAAATLSAANNANNAVQSGGVSVAGGGASKMKDSSTRTQIP